MARLFPSPQGAASEEAFGNANEERLAFSDSISYLSSV